MTVPIVGQPGEAVTWYPTAIVHCKCVPPPTLSLLITTGFHNHTVCPNCGVEYWIAGIKPDGTILIDFRLPMAPGRVM